MYELDNCVYFVLENCDKIMHFCFNFDACPMHLTFGFMHLTYQNLSAPAYFCNNSLAKVSISISYFINIIFSYFILLYCCNTPYIISCYTFCAIGHGFLKLSKSVLFERTLLFVDRAGKIIIKLMEPPKIHIFTSLVCWCSNANQQWLLTMSDTGFCSCLYTSRFLWSCSYVGLIFYAILLWLLQVGLSSGKGTLKQGRGQDKSLGGLRNLGGPGGRAPWWGSGGKAPGSWSLLSAKIVIKALPEHKFPC